MKRILIALVVVAGLVSVLCLGLVFAVAFTPLRDQVGQVIQRVAQRANLNFEARPFNNTDELPSRVGGQNTAAEEGILIAGVLSGSPAEQAGLRRGDILLQVNDQAVNSLPDLMQALQDVETGNAIRLSVQRGDETVTLNVQASGAANEQYGLLHGGMLGIVPCTDGDMLRGFGSLPQFEQAARAGAQITSVVDDSPAQQAGLQAGEWIVAINGDEISQPGEVSEIVQQSEPGDELTLTVEDSAGQQREVVVTLAQKPDGEMAWLGVSLGSSFERRLPNLPNSGSQDGSGIPNLANPPSLPDGYEAGAVLIEVVEDGPAAKAGLQTGQVILAIDGQNLASSEQLKSKISSYQPGDEVTLLVSGPGGQAAQEVPVTLGENPDQARAPYLGIRYGFIQVSPETTPSDPVN